MWCGLAEPAYDMLPGQRYTPPVCWGGGEGGGRRRAVTCLSEHDGAAEHRPCEELERPPLGGHAVATRRGRGRKFSERKRKAERKI